MTLTALEDVTRLSSRVIRVLAQNPGVGPLQGTNTYVIGTGSRRLLVDTGDNPDQNTSANVKKYHELLQKELGACNAKIDKILLTHWHPDHTGGVEAILQSKHELVCPAGVEVMKFNCRRGEDEQLPFTNKYTSTLQDKQTVLTEGATLTVLYTPGHATDHASLLLEEESVLFSGDCILGETSAIVEDLASYMQTLQSYLDLDKPVKKIFPGHGPVVEDGAAKIKEYINHRMKREHQIVDCLKTGPKTIEEILETVYVGLDQKLKLLALKNIEVHLQKLVNENVVISESENNLYRIV